LPHEHLHHEAGHHHGKGVQRPPEPLTPFSPSSAPPPTIRGSHACPTARPGHKQRFPTASSSSPAPAPGSVNPPRESSSHAARASSSTPAVASGSRPSPPR